MIDHELRETVNAACECGGGGPNDAEAKLARIREAWARYDVDHEPGMASVVEPRTLVTLRAAIEKP